MNGLIVTANCKSCSKSLFPKQLNPTFTMNTHRRIDTHFHIVPDIFAEAVEETGGDPSGWLIPGWSLEQARTHLKELGISSAIVSGTAPGTSMYADDIDKGRHWLSQVQ